MLYITYIYCYFCSVCHPTSDVPYENVRVDAAALSGNNSNNAMIDIDNIEKQIEFYMRLGHLKMVKHLLSQIIAALLVSAFGLLCICDTRHIHSS